MKFFPSLGHGPPLTLKSLGILRLRDLLTAAGGALLKQRNAQGDRVVGAFDVFEAHGLADFEAQDVPVRWSSGDAALLADLPVTDN